MRLRPRTTVPPAEPYVGLLEHLMAILAEHDLRYAQRFAAQEAATAVALSSANRAVDQLGTTAGIRAEVAEIRTLVNAQGALTDAKFVTYRALIDSQAEKVALALASSDKAVGKAEVATEKRFDAVNEFRQTLADQARDLMPRLEAEQRIKQLADEMALLRGTSRAGATALLGWIVGAIGLVSAVIAISSRVG